MVLLAIFPQIFTLCVPWLEILTRKVLIIEKNERAKDVESVGEKAQSYNLYLKVGV